MSNLISRLIFSRNEICQILLLGKIFREMEEVNSLNYFCKMRDFSILTVFCG
jgi:hypothetical protein